MKAVRPTDLRANMKAFLDDAANGETVVISRQGNRNVVVISENEYNRLQKAARNAAYLGMLDQSMDELARGDLVTVSLNELRRAEG